MISHPDSIRIFLSALAIPKLMHTIIVLCLLGSKALSLQTACCNSLYNASRTAVRRLSSACAKRGACFATSAHNERTLSSTFRTTVLEVCPLRCDSLHPLRGQITLARALDHDA